MEGISLIKNYIKLLVERQVRQVSLSKDRTADWGSTDHIDDLQTRIGDAEYWRDKCARGTEKRSHYKHLVNHLKRELQSAKKRQQINEKQK